MLLVVLPGAGMFEMPFSLPWLAPELRLGTASLPVQPVQDGWTSLSASICPQSGVPENTSRLQVLFTPLLALQAKTSHRVRPRVSVEVPTKM